MKPEKLNQAASISEGLTKLNQGLLKEDDTDDLVTQIKEFVGDQFHDEYINRLDKMMQKMDDMATKVQIVQLEGQLRYLQRELDAKNVVIDTMKGDIIDLKNKNDLLDARVQRLENTLANVKLNQTNAQFHAINNEQYQRKNNLVIFGVKESAPGIKEDCKAAASEIMKKCVPTVTKHDIDVAHRVGPVGGRPRPIIAKIKTHEVRWEVLTKRKALKGAKEGGFALSIGEDITKDYQDLIAKIKAAGLTCWYWNTRVWIERSDGTSISVQIQDNWELKVNDYTIKGRKKK